MKYLSWVKILTLWVIELDTDKCVLGNYSIHAVVKNEIEYFLFNINT